LTKQAGAGGSGSGGAKQSSRRLSGLLLLGLLAKYSGSGSGCGGTESPCGGLSKDRLVRG